MSNYNRLPSISDYISGVYRGEFHGFETGFNLVNCFIKIFVEDAILAMGIIVVFCVLGVTFQISRYTQFWFIALLVYVGHFWGWNGLILFRQTIALVILFPLLNWIPEKKYFRAILLILFASLFHASSLIYLLIFPLYRILRSDRVLILAIVASFLIGYFGIIPNLVIMVSEHIPRGEILVNHIINSERGINWLAYFVMLSVLGVALYFKQTLVQHNKHIRMAITYLGFAVILAGLFQQFEIVIRFIMSFNFYAYIILLPAFICIFKDNWKNRLIYVSFLGLYLMIFFVRFFYIL
ncbi:MAG: EpsG family protein [Bacteroidales bacterium]|nr:EpsG family protein [Bacteroidales bacterium]